MKSRSGRIFKRTVYFILSACALQSLAFVIYSIFILCDVVDMQYDQGTAFQYIFAVLECIVIAAIYQLCYKEETSPVTRKLFLGWSFLVYLCSFIPGVFANIRFELLTSGIDLNYYVDEWLTMTIITLHAVNVLITVTTAVMIIIDMVKNFEIVE